MFCTPEKLKDILGSSSSVGSSDENNISFTPCKTKAAPKFNAKVPKVPNCKPPADVRAAKPPPVAIANPSNTAPAINFLAPDPAPDIAGTKCISCYPTG